MKITLFLKFIPKPEIDWMDNIAIQSILIDKEKKDLPFIWPFKYLPYKFYTEKSIIPKSNKSIKNLSKFISNFTWACSQFKQTDNSFIC